MNELESEFDEIAQSLKPPAHRFDAQALSRHDEHLARALAHTRTMQVAIDEFKLSGQTTALGTMPDVYLDFTTQEGFRAFVRKRERYFIGVSIGMIVELRESFQGMVQDPAFVPQVEDAPLPVYAVPFGEVALYTHEPDVWLGRLPDGVRPILMPTEREKLAERLLNRALQFVILHELAHVRNGHYDMVNALLGKPAILDIESDLPSETDALTRQALEMDADSWATNQMVTQMAHTVRTSKPQPAWWYKDGSPIREALVELSVSVFVLFMSSMKSDHRLNVFRVAHPPTVWRLNSYLVLMVTRLILGTDGLTPDQFFGAVNPALDETASAFAKINERWRPYDGGRDTGAYGNAEFQDECFYQSKRIIEHWGNVVLSQLQGFTHASDLVPPQPEWSDVPPSLRRPHD